MPTNERARIVRLLAICGCASVLRQFPLRGNWPLIAGILGMQNARTARAAPEITRAFVETLVASWIVANRELNGTRACAETVMGPWRRAVGSTLPPNAVGISAALEGRSQAAGFLRDFCNGCGGCELGRVPQEESADAVMR